MATFSVSALAIEIRDIIAQSVGLGNAAPLATHVAVNPHQLPPFPIKINDLFCHSNHCLFIQWSLHSPENRPRGIEGVQRC